MGTGKIGGVDMTKQDVIKIWKQGYSKKKIVEEHLEGHSRKVLATCNPRKKPTMNQLEEEAQKEVENILLEWWKTEVLEIKK